MQQLLFTRFSTQYPDIINIIFLHLAGAQNELSRRYNTHADERPFLPFVDVLSAIFLKAIRHCRLDVALHFHHANPLPEAQTRQRYGPRTFPPDPQMLAPFT